MPLSANMGYSSASPAFRTHAHFISSDMKTRPRSTQEPVRLHRSKSFIEQPMSLQLSPFLLRKSVTNFKELQPVNSTPSRTKSARHGAGKPIIMPRSHVSVARFYDWSDDLGDCFSVSKLYREIASIPRVAPNSIASVNGQMTVNCGVNTASISINASRQFSVNPRRMFVRDKRALTRGEKEIIEGIYKNRGDVSARDAVIKSEFQVKHHQDAWYAGKPVSDSLAYEYDKVLLKGEKIESRTSKFCGPLYSDRPFTSLAGGNVSDGSRSKSPKLSCSPDLRHNLDRKMKLFPDPMSSDACTICQQHGDAHNMSNRTVNIQSRDGAWDLSPSAPPSTPDQEDAYFSTQQQPMFDKLLGMRPTLPPNSVLFSEKINVSNGHPSNGHHSELKYITNRKKQSHRKAEKEPADFMQWASGDFAILPLQSSKYSSIRMMQNRPVTDSHEIIKEMKHDESDFTQKEIMNDSASVLSASNSELEEDSEDSQRDERRVLKVYLPSAETEERDEDFSVVTRTGKPLLIKERPLSHREFKGRSIRDWS